MRTGPSPRNRENLTEAKHKAVLEQDDNMQVLTRTVLNTVGRHALKSRQVPLAVANMVKAQKPRLSVWQQSPNYATCAADEQKLLRFPVMKLRETLDLFVKTCEPLLDCQEMEQTRQCVEEFSTKDGPILQGHLEEVASKEENWLASRWLRAAYMQYRDPVTIFSSPGMTFPLQAPFECDESLCTYAAKLTFNLIKYKQLVDEKKIPVVKMGDLELDNSQFGRVFGTCRIPGLPEDSVEYHPKSKHIVVIYKNNFFKLPVYDNNGKPLHINILKSNMLKIMRGGYCEGAKFGLLTTDKRDNWAAIYAELMEDDCNKSSIKEIQKALFTLSLDLTVSLDEKNKYSVLSEQLIHGGGAKVNAANRWMDKTIQLIINPCGLSGFTYEHSPAEGQPIALIVDYVIKNLKNEKFYECGSQEDCQEVSKLPLKATGSFEKYVQCAERGLDELVNDLEMVVLHYKNYGKGFLKSQKLSPDSYLQMAQQLAFYKLHQVPAPHYESAHLRIYKDGRTETIRSCSNESVAFTKSMLDINATAAERVCLLRKAVNGHRAYTNLALQGKGVDRHLLGLKLMAVEKKLPIPSLFSCPGYIKSSHYRLSTSQVASANPVFMCYGPMVKDGYSCCYNPREDDLFFAIGGWRSCQITNAQIFAKSLNESLNMMEAVLRKAGSSDKPKAKL